MLQRTAARGVTLWSSVSRLSSKNPNSRAASQLRIPGRRAAVGLSPLHRQYHSYPDPNEKPVIQQTRSDVTKQLDKSQPEFKLHDKFKLDKLFPGTPVSKGIGSAPPPDTVSTKIENGLTVASQDLPGLMTTIALVVRTGSAYERQAGADTNLGATHFLELNAFRSTRNRSYKQVQISISTYELLCYSGC